MKIFIKKYLNVLTCKKQYVRNKINKYIKTHLAIIKKYIYPFPPM
jgi:hypothetical protein